MTRWLIGRIGVALGFMLLPWMSACCADGKCDAPKVYVDKYERVPCKNCPKTKYVYHEAPCVPDKIVRVHRIMEPCPPQRVVHVQLPPKKQKVKYEYVTEGSCKKPCGDPCKRPCDHDDDDDKYVMAR